MSSLGRLLLVVVVLLGSGWTDPSWVRLEFSHIPAGFSVRYHPDGGLVVGDHVSIQVFSPTGYKTEGVKIRVALLYPAPRLLGEAEFSPNGFGWQQAVLQWAWDTQGLAPGYYAVEFSLLPGGETWVDSVYLAEGTQIQPRWLVRETACCRLHYLSGSDAERDMDQLALIIEQQASSVAARLGYYPELRKPAISSKVEINFVPRVLGQGGFTGDEVIISYSDQNYIRTDLAMVVHHELVHRLDAALGAKLRPTMLAEGLAVYLSGGHYKKEPLLLRAVFLDLQGAYVPLATLAEDFYSHQHESGYLEAAALVEHLVYTYGWDAFHRFYRDIEPAPSGKDGDAIDLALRRHFGLTLGMLEDRFLLDLDRQPLIPDLATDLLLASDYFETIRMYQQAFDPAAFFQQVWLPNPDEMRQRGISADYVRSPQGGLSQDLREMLAEAGQDWRAGRFSQAWQRLEVIRQMSRSAGQ